MPHFIKTGFWEKAQKGAFGWLNLERLIQEASIPISVQEALNEKLDKVNSSIALVDAATMDLTSPKHTLSSSAANRTFTISYTGDDITLVVTLSAASATYTFPATALCVSEGTASGDNTLSLAGVSGDTYVIGIKKVNSAYYIVAKNFGQ